MLNDTATLGYGTQKPHWVNVSASAPCRICQRGDWCSISEDLVWALCRRSADHPTFGNGTEKVDASGANYWVYRLDGSGPSSNGREEPRFTHTSRDRKRADPDTLHRVYSTFLDALPLTGTHLLNLKERGLCHENGSAGPVAKPLGYRSLNQKRLKGVQAVLDAGLEEQLPHVPGFFVKEYDSGRSSWTITGGGGLLVPVRDHKRRIIALLVRLDEPRKGTGKYRYLSSKKRGGVGSGAATGTRDIVDAVQRPPGSGPEQPG
jgi:hypothetical protein